MASPYITLPRITYLRPSSVGELLQILEEKGEAAKILAGGVALIPLLRERLVQAEYLVDIKGIGELHRISYTPGEGLRVGATATLAELEEYLDSTGLAARFSALRRALSRMADPILRNRATLAGNVVEALPIVDGPGILALYGARLRILSSGGSREAGIGEFVRGPGLVDLRPGELVEEILIPEPPKGALQAYYKNTPATEYSVASLGILMDPGGGFARVVVASATPAPLVAERASKVLAEGGRSSGVIVRALEELEREVEEHVIEDHMASKEYRIHLLKISLAAGVRETLGVGGR